MVPFVLPLLKKNKLRLISSGFYPALRTPSFRHPKYKKINPKIQQKKKLFFSCLVSGYFVYLVYNKGYESKYI